MRYFLNLPDEEFVRFARRFTNGLDEIAAAVDFDADLANELETAVGEMETVFDEHAATRLQMKSLTQRKDKVFRQVRDLLKKSTREVRGKPETTEAQLKALGLQPYDATRTTAALPENAPHLMTEIEKNRRHTLHIRQRVGGATKKAKPRGVLGAEIWLRVGDAGVLGEDNYRYLGMASSGTFTFQHDAADIGKQAFYIARWLNRKGERGGWSDTAAATIAA